MRLKELNLLSLQTLYMQQDETTKAICLALEPQLKEIANAIKLCVIYTRLEELNEKILDELAWEMHIDFWDSSIDIVKKRELIKSAFIIHMTKGTPYAVEKLISTIFDDGYVEEWFDYAGEPYTFRVVTNNSTVTNEKAKEFIRALDSVKNLRSHLDKVVITLSEELPLYFGGIVHTGDILTIDVKEE